MHNLYTLKYLEHDLIALVGDSFIVKFADGIQRQLAYDQIKPFETQCQCKRKLPSGPTVWLWPILSLISIFLCPAFVDKQHSNYIYFSTFQTFSFKKFLHLVHCVTILIPIFTLFVKSHAIPTFEQQLA